EAVGGRALQHDAANDRVQAGSVAAAGEDADLHAAAFMLGKRETGRRCLQPTLVPNRAGCHSSARENTESCRCLRSFCPHIGGSSGIERKRPSRTSILNALSEDDNDQLASSVSRSRCISAASCTGSTAVSSTDSPSRVC